jgi:hypothetical protein
LPPPATPPTQLPGYVPRTKFANVIARSGEGFLEDQGGRKILHLKGDAYTRGFQYGALFGDEVDASRKAVVNFAASKFSPALGVLVGAVVGYLQPYIAQIAAGLFSSYISPDDRAIMQGIVDGARSRSPSIDVKIEELMLLNVIIDLGGMVDSPTFKCSGLAVWGSRTQGGKMFQQRNVDLLVGSGLESQAVVAIDKPDSGNAYLNAGWAGLVGTASGMNEHGLGISQVWAFSRDVAFGEPWPLTCRRLLETASNVDAVQPAFSAVKRTYGSNFVFADRGDGSGKPRGLACESSSKDFLQFFANDPGEDALWNGQPIAIKLTEAVFRGDVPVSQRVYDRWYEDPKTTDPRTTDHYQERYQQQADLTKGYETQGVKIGLAEMEAIARKIGHAGSSLQCVVYENTDLMVHVANSRVVPGSAPADARDEPFHDYDLDYYLPTVQVVPDRAAYAVGDTMALTLTVGNHGRSRRLDAALWLETTGTHPVLGTKTGIEVLTGQSVGTTLVCSVPAGATPGQAEIVVELREAGTADVVDYACFPVTIH